MKIGLVTGEYPPMEGGVGAFTEALARELAVLGHEVFIVTSYKARPVSKKSDRAHPNDPIDIGYAKLLPLTRHWTWRDANLVADLAIRYAFDVVNIQYQAAAYNMRRLAINLLPWRLRGVCPTVVTFHDLRVPYLLPKIARVRQAAVNKMARDADGVIVTNAADHQTITTTLPGLTVAQIPIGSNIPVHATADTLSADTLSNEEKLKIRTKLGLEESDQLLGYFGFLNESKGADVLIDALAQLRALGRPIHLVFIGGQTGASDPNNNETFLQTIHQQIAEHGLSDVVHWTGFVEDEDVSRYLCTADLIVLPYKDGASLRRGTLMAALAHGCPIVTTAPQIVNFPIKHRKQAWLIEPPMQFTAAIDHLLRDKTMRAKLGSNANLLSKQFTWDKIAQQTEAFCEQLYRK